MWLSYISQKSRVVLYTTYIYSIKITVICYKRKAWRERQYYLSYHWAKIHVFNRVIQFREISSQLTTLWPFGSYWINQPSVIYHLFSVDLLTEVIWFTDYEFYINTLLILTLYIPHKVQNSISKPIVLYDSLLNPVLKFMTTY